MNLKAIIAAFQFLTIIPIKTKWVVDERILVRSVIFFPLVGVFQGLVLAFVILLGLMFFSPHLAATFAILMYIFTNGGFHQDGLSDTFDALSVKSSGDKEKDREKRLTVMKGSTAGPIGVIAILFSLLLKYLLMMEIISKVGLPDVYLFFFLMPIFAKNTMVWTLSGAKNARNDGLGKVFLEGTGFVHTLASTALLCFIATGSFILFRHYCLLSFSWTINRIFGLFISEIFILWLAVSFLRRFFTGRFGGLTGDNLGAVHEISEIFFLIVIVLWS